MVSLLSSSTSEEERSSSSAGVSSLSSSKMASNSEELSLSRGAAASPRPGTTSSECRIALCGLGKVASRGGATGFSGGL